MKQYDYIMLGTGPGGYQLAGLLAKTSKKVLAIEGGLFGGTCPNVGCEPKIFFEGAVHAVLRSQQLLGHGIAQAATIDWSQLMATKLARFDEWPQQTEAIYRKMCDVEVGYGKFISPHVIEVNGHQYQGDKIIIATGRRARQLDFPGHEYTHDSTDVLSLGHLPKRATFIGGGYIAMELATLLAAAGSQVDILIRSERVLRAFYSEHTQKLVQAMTKRGIKFHFNTQVQKIEKTAQHYFVTTDTQEELPSNYVIVASGRIPNVERLDLPAAGIKATAKGIDVDDHLQTNVKDVYALGDVTNQKTPKLTPVAQFEADYLFDYLEKANDQSIQYPTIGTAAYAFPEIAQAGVNPDQAKAKQGYRVVDQDLTGGSIYAGMHDDVAHLTLVYDQDQRLVGASEVSTTAADDINNLIPVMGLKLTQARWHEQLLPIYPALASKVEGLLS